MSSTSTFSSPVSFARSPTPLTSSSFSSFTPILVQHALDGSSSSSSSSSLSLSSSLLVSVIEVSTSVHCHLIAVGYDNGMVRVYDGELSVSSSAAAAKPILIDTFNFNTFNFSVNQVHHDASHDKSRRGEGGEGGGGGDGEEGAGVSVTALHVDEAQRLLYCGFSHGFMISKLIPPTPNPTSTVTPNFNLCPSSSSSSSSSPSSSSSMVGVSLFECFNEVCMPIRSLNVNPFGTFIAVGGHHGYVKIMDSRSRAMTTQIRVSDAPVTKVCHTPDGTWLICCATHLLQIYNLQNSSLLFEFSTLSTSPSSCSSSLSSLLIESSACPSSSSSSLSNIVDVCCHPSELLLAVSSARSLFFIDLEEFQVVSEYHHVIDSSTKTHIHFSDISFDSTGTVLVSVSQNSQLTLWKWEPAVQLCTASFPFIADPVSSDSLSSSSSSTPSPAAASSLSSLSSTSPPPLQTTAGATTINTSSCYLKVTNRHAIVVVANGATIHLSSLDLKSVDSSFSSDGRSAFTSNRSSSSDDGNFVATGIVAHNCYNPSSTLSRSRIATATSSGGAGGFGSPHRLHSPISLTYHHHPRVSPSILSTSFAQLKVFSVASPPCSSLSTVSTQPPFPVLTTARSPSPRTLPQYQQPLQLLSASASAHSPLASSSCSTTSTSLHHRRHRSFSRDSLPTRSPPPVVASSSSSSSSLSIRRGSASALTVETAPEGGADGEVLVIGGKDSNVAASSASSCSALSSSSSSVIRRLPGSKCTSGRSKSPLSATASFSSPLASSQQTTTPAKLLRTASACLASPYRSPSSFSSSSSSLSFASASSSSSSSFSWYSSLLVVRQRMIRSLVEPWRHGDVSAFVMTLHDLFAEPPHPAAAASLTGSPPLTTCAAASDIRSVAASRSPCQSRSPSHSPCRSPSSMPSSVTFFPLHSDSSLTDTITTTTTTMIFREGHSHSISTLNCSRSMSSCAKNCKIEGGVTAGGAGSAYSQRFAVAYDVLTRVRPQLIQRWSTLHALTLLPVLLQLLQQPFHNYVSLALNYLDDMLRSFENILTDPTSTEFSKFQPQLQLAFALVKLHECSPSLANLVSPFLSKLQMQCAVEMQSGFVGALADAHS